MIDAVNPRPAADDLRPRDVRQADALAALARHVLSDTRTTPGATAPVQAVVTIGERTWAALRGRRRPPADARGGRSLPGSAGDTMIALRGVTPVIDEGGRPWPAAEVARALCDCALTRAVVDADGRVVDLGRDERLFRRANWLVLLASGQRTCAVGGCSMPLRYTELHHMAWWDRDGGRTDQENCAPECSYHHGEIHRLDIRVTRRRDGTYAHRYPDGRQYGGPPHSGAPPDAPEVALVAGASATGGAP